MYINAAQRFHIFSRVIHKSIHIYENSDEKINLYRLENIFLISHIVYMYLYVPMREFIHVELSTANTVRVT